MQFTIYNLQFTNKGVTRVGEPQGRGPVLVSRRKGLGADERQDPVEDGQSLFELVVSIAISAIVIVAIVSLATNAVRNATYSRNNSTAVALAGDAIEWLRAERDSNINGFLTKAQTPTWCFVNTSPVDWSKPGNCSATDLINNIFKREGNFSINLSSGKTIVNISINISWTDSQGSHKVTNSTYFTDWRQR